jgi:ActR/RegA family two-component response regulator
VHSDDVNHGASPALEHETQVDTKATAVNPAEPASLRDADEDFIARTLQECDGNVSAAARKLKVSRGLIYRRSKGV